MSSEGIYHYVYRITNLVESKHYYGKRSSKIEPHLDLGKKYFSSSKDKNFIKDQKENPQNYKYKVVFICKSARRAIELETTLHDMFDVGRNQSFYNKVKQNGNGFDSTGIVVVKNSLGETFSVSVDDPRFISGELKHVNVGKITVKNSLGETFSVSVDDPRFISGELVGANAGNVIVKDIHGNTFSVSVDDPRYISGELKHVATDMVVVKNSLGNKFSVSKDDPRYSSGELVGIAKGMVVVKNSLGETFSVSKDDPEYISGELVGVNAGNVIVKNSLGETFSVSKDDPRFISGELVGVTTGMTVAKDIHGNTFSVSVDDPRYISGELKHAADGYKHTSEAKRKMSDRNKGTKLVYNIELDKSMRLKQEEAINLVKSNTGWKLGRKPKDVIY